MCKLLYITKHALTLGIYIRHLNENKNPEMKGVYNEPIETTGEVNHLVLGFNCFEREKDAIKRAKELRDDKIKELNEEIKRLKWMNFDPKFLY
jgi:hypothetical protein